MNFMVPGGIIAFDKCGMPELPGETKAVNEFIKKHNFVLHDMLNTFAPTSYTVL